MRSIFSISLLAFLFIVSSCNGPTANIDKIDAEVSNLYWLLGNWQRIDEVEGKRTYETWYKNKSGEYHGHGLTLLNVDTVFEEHMKIHKTDEEWFLEVSGVNEDPKIFSFTDLSDDRFVSYCVENEFPKKIEYYFDGSLLIAEISDVQTKVQFQFSRDMVAQ